MAQIFSGRYTAKTDQPFVLFLIGMRINNLWQMGKWWSVAKEMPPMMRTLTNHPEKGFLGGYSALSWPNIIQVQSWRSFEQLEHFARNPDDPHAAAWKRFYQKVGTDGAVGIWHETYQVYPGQFECIYGNMPKFGLGSMFDHISVSGRMNSGRMNSARQRRSEVDEKVRVAA